MGAVKRIKNIEWEKNRRDRLNLTFFELSQLLPDHDPTLTLTKGEILNKSIAYLKELKEKNSSLVESHCSDALKSEMSSLKQQLEKLQRRNRQLADLLRAAEINLPGRPASHNPAPLSPPRKWANKLSSQSTNNLSDTAQKIVKKEKKIKNSPAKKKTAKRKKKVKNTKQVGLSTVVKKSVTKAPVTSTNTPLREINNTASKSGQGHPRTITLPCTTISLVLSNPKTNIVTVAKSNILTAPIMATGIQPVLQRNPALSRLGPGTLIMADGRIMPVPPAPSTVLAATTQIIVNRPATQPAVIVMQNIASVKPVQNSQPRLIVPKLRRRDTTKTTFSNKVPIPAISSYSAINKPVPDLGKNKPTQTKDNKKCTNKKKLVVKKEGAGEKAVLSDKSKKPDKPVVVEPVRDKIPEAVNQPNKHEESNSDKNVSNDIIKTFVDSGAPSVDNQNNQARENVTGTVGKRKIIEQAEVSKSKRQKVDDAVSCNKEEVSQQTDKVSSQKSDNNEKYSIDALCTHENEKETNLQSIAPKEIAKETTSTPENNLMQKETSTNIEKQTNILQSSEKSREENKETSRISSSSEHKTEVKAANNNDTLKEMVVENNAEHQNTITNCIDNTNKILVEETSTLTLQKNKTTQIATVQLARSEHLTSTVENKSAQISQSTTADIDSKKAVESGKKTNPEKSVIQDDSQELASLFPTDSKLQSCPENMFREADFRDRNLFMPISHSYMDEVRLSLPHSDFSNDLFSSLQVPTGGQHPESISPTAAFLLAFPLVSTSKTSELIAESEANESQHATPTTILQIGNIDPPGSELYHQASLMIENNVNSLDDPMKLNKSTENMKNNSSKQLKEVEHFNKFHHLEMNDLMRSENFSRNNCKEKKNFTGLQEHDMFLPCNKKKSNARSCNYPLPSEVIPHFQEKPFEFPSHNVRHTVQNPSTSHGRQVGSSSSQKKTQIPTENLINHQNPYNASSQTYTYNTFPNGNDFAVPNPNYLSTNRPGNETSKTHQNSTDFSATSWSTTSITATTNRTDYTSPYCSYPQKQFTNPPNKSMPQKVHQTNYEDQRLKEKSTSTNSLPKFSSNFQFNSNSRPTQDVHNYPQSNQPDSMNYKLEAKTKKQKTGSQRPPVNWMTTPDVRPVLPDPNIAPVLPDVMFHPQKELDFNPTANNATLSTSTNITPFNIPSSGANNPQTFYPNSHFSGIDLQLDFAPFPEIVSSSKPSSTSASTSQQNPHHYSWSPSKSSIPLLPHIDNHMIPSTLPTLVGDLALGTTTPSGPIDTFRSLSMSTTPFTMDNPVKKCDSKNDSQKPISGKSPEKECYANSDRRTGNRNIPNYCQKTHQSTNTTSSFLSVSQLVDHAKSEQSSSRRAGKQAMTSKNNSNIQKRNLNNHQTDKSNHTKMTNIVNNPNNYHPQNPINPAMVNQRKPDVHAGYQESHNAGVGFPGAFGNNVGPPPWQNGKPQRSTTHYKGSYSAESLIGDQSAPPPQDHVADLTPFSMANQFSNQYSHAQKPFLDTPIVTSASYTSTDFSHQNMQPLEFHQHSHQNFNFPTHNTHYSSGSFNTENDYHVGLDPLYNFNHPSARNNSSCQTPSHASKDNRNVSNSKRNPASKRREDFPPQFLQTPQTYPAAARVKCPPVPPSVQCPTTSSPAHQGTTTLTNFNLSTIFPEINDKRAVQGSNTFHTSSSKHSVDNSTGRLSGRPDYPVTNFNPSLAPQMQQVGISAPPHFPPVSFANLGPPPGNFRPQ